ncbi:MAG: hypothetical protein KKI06_14190 [Euryarchaeota archaeon]|nr:hypothetical protein [Euryarchaeota archaeon]
MNAVGALTILFLIFSVISYSGGKYNNALIHLEIAAFLGVISIVVRFQACLSFIIFTNRSPSMFFIKGQDSILPAGLVYTFVTLLLGWWGIPWGPIYTVQTIYINLRGGHKQTIGDLINNIEKTSVAEDKQKDAIHPT